MFVVTVLPLVTLQFTCMQDRIANEQTGKRACMFMFSTKSNVFSLMLFYACLKSHVKPPNKQWMTEVF